MGRGSHIGGMSDVAAPVKISVNGEARAVTPGMSVAGLLAELGLDRRKVAVERNEAIVVRSLYEDTRLGAGDMLEIVHFIGGG